MNQFKGNDNRLDSAWVPTLAKRLANKGLIDIVTNCARGATTLSFGATRGGITGNRGPHTEQGKQWYRGSSESDEADAGSSCKGDSRRIVFSLY